MRKPIKVLIIDDSQLIRSLLTEILTQDSAIEVVGVAIDPLDAREKIKQLQPDVITLDIEMPKMDGITFLRNLMRLRPMPVVMISTLTEKGAGVTLEALEIGAIDYISKPKVDVPDKLRSLTQEIVNKVKHAARVNVGGISRAETAVHRLSDLSGKVNAGQSQFELLAIGASTGGTVATRSLLESLPDEMPPIVVVQHMPPGFTRSYAERLNGALPFTVAELDRSDVELKNNHVWVANGDQHMRVRRRGNRLFVDCDDAEPRNRHRPSVDVLFESIAESGPEKTIGVILTGMGLDGAAGMKAMFDGRSHTIAQDQATSVVWGMPRVAVEQGGVCDVLPLQKIGQRIEGLCYR